MKARRFLGWILILVMCFTFVSCQDTTANTDDTSAVVSVESVSSETVSTETVSSETASIQAVSSEVPDESSESSDKAELDWDGATPLLYCVTDDKGNTIWLFGSIHVGRESFYPFADYLYIPYATSEVLAVEADVVAFEEDLNAQVKALTNMVYRYSSNTIQDYIDAELYQKAVKILTDNGIYTTDFERFRPAFWSNLIDNLTVAKAGIDASLGIDYNLIWDAKANEKTIEEIESADFQYAMMADFSHPLQEMLLASSVESYENVGEYKKNIDMLLDAWEKGDEAELEAVLASEEEQVSPEEKELYEEYKKAVITDRNIKMAEYAEQALESGKKTFICVGAAHVVGKGAMVDLLRQKGYNVTIVEPYVLPMY